MYDFLSEKPLRLAKFYGMGGTFNLAILILFTRASIDGFAKSPNSVLHCILRHCGVY